MKPTISKIKSVRGRIIGYSAKLDGIEGRGDTARMAVETLETLLLSALDRLRRGSRNLRAWGHVYNVSPTLDGWEYHLDTFQNGYTVHHPFLESLEEVCDHAIVHLGQNVWTPETDDRAFLDEGMSPDARRELAGWIGFQRAYIAAPENTEDKHRWACENASVYTPPATLGETIPAPAIH